MKRLLTLSLLAMFCAAFVYGQTHIGAKFIPKLKTTKPDSGWFGDIGIRGALVTPDLDHDGKPELILTDYTKTGRVHMFQAVGNDSLEWIWSSPRDTAILGLGGNSTPRAICYGDMDNDGKGEIIVPRQGKGFLIYEWDGVNGSHKFGTKPSAIIPINVAYGSNYGALAGTPNEGNLQLSIEQFQVIDVDGDGQQELLTPKNVSGNPNDDFLIISADGDWSYEDQGFASFKIEGSAKRLVVNNFGGAGAPYAMHAADVDGDGKYEIVCHPWNFGAYFMMKATGPDTYVLPDTSASNIKRYYYQAGVGNDQVALFGGTVADLDKDGNQEVYFPWFNADAEIGNVQIVNYSRGDNVLDADETHSKRIFRAISQDGDGNAIACFMGVAADMNRNGKPEIIVGSSYPSNAVAMEFQGGKIDDSSAYKRIVYYKGEPDIYASLTFRDSLGRKDTVKVAGEGFVSKMTNPIDFDGDGKLEIFMPYQALTDSATYTWQHWKTDSTKFSTDSSKLVTNPKKWIVRALESDVAGGVSLKDYTVITPEDYKLMQNYPNPFNPSTEINFTLPLVKKVNLKVYDMLGREVRTLINNDEYAKGSHSVVWNGKDNFGKSVATGSYVYTLRVGNMEKSLKMVLLK